jgi:hypothetical protein
MPVPYTGSYKMFDTGSTENPNSNSIRGAQRHNALDDVAGTKALKFTQAVSKAKLQRFDRRYCGPNINSLDQITSSLQWRGYPMDLNNLLCFKGAFTEILFPNQWSTTFILYELDDEASGSLQYDMAAPEPEQLTVYSNTGTTVYVSVVTQSDTIFEGWSTSPSVLDIVSTGSTYGHTVEDYNFTIYALISTGDAVSQDFCYYSTLTGQNDRCATDSCTDIRTIFFSRDSLATSSLDEVIWYSNVSLTSYASNGYYKPINEVVGDRGQVINVIDGTNYLITGSSGNAHVHSTCANGYIYCT